MADDIKRVVFRLDGEGSDLKKELIAVRDGYVQANKAKNDFNKKGGDRAGAGAIREELGVIPKLIQEIEKLEKLRLRSQDPKKVQEYTRLIEQQRTKLVQLTTVEKQQVQVHGIINNLLVKQQQLIKARDESKNIRQVKELGKEIDKVTRQIDKLRNTNNKGGLFGGFGQLAAGAAGGFGVVGLVNGIKQLGTEAFTQSINFEKTRISFETMLGSGEKAEKFLGSLVDFAAKTPFQLPELQQASRLLLAFGEDASSVTTTLKQLGDIAAGTDQPINELAFIIGKARATQTLYNEDLNQLSERGIPVLDVLAKKYNTTAAGIKKMSSEGKIGFADLQFAMNELTKEGGRFFNLTSKLAESTAGRISTLSDNFGLFLKKLGDEGKPILDDLIDRGSALLESIDPKKFLNTIVTVTKLVAVFLAYRSGLIVVTAVQRAYTITMAAARTATLLFSAAQAALAGNVTKAAAAMRLLGVVTKANPIVLLTSLIIAAAAAMYLFSRRTKEAVDINRTLAKVNNEVNQKFETESQKLKLLFDQLKLTNPQTAERKKLVKELNDLYPGFISNINLEKASTQELVGVYNEYLTQLKESIRLKVLESNAIEKENELLDLQNKKNKTFQDLDKIEQLKREKKALLDELVDINNVKAFGQAATDLIKQKEEIDKEIISRTNKQFFGDQEAVDQAIAENNVRIEELRRQSADLDKQISEKAKEFATNKPTNPNTPTVEDKKAKDLSGELDKLREQLNKLTDDRELFWLNNNKGLIGIERMNDFLQRQLQIQLELQKIELQKKGVLSQDPATDNAFQAQAREVFNRIVDESFMILEAEGQKKIDEFNAIRLKKEEDLQFQMRQLQLIEIDGSQDALIKAAEERFEREKKQAIEAQKETGEDITLVLAEIEQRRQQEILNIKRQFEEQDLQAELRALDVEEQTRLSKVKEGTINTEKEKLAIQIQFAQERLKLAQATLDQLLDIEEQTGGNAELTKQIEALQLQVQELNNELNNLGKGLAQGGGQKLTDTFKKIATVMEQVVKLTDAIIDGIQQIIAEEEKRTDFLIEQQQKRVDAATSLAEKGNAELLEQEQKRLDELNKKRKQQAQTQKALDAIQFFSASALAIARAAAEGGGFGSIALIATVIGAIAGGIATISSLTEGFRHGVIDLQGPGTETSDSIPARLSKRESVMTAEETKSSKKTLLAIRAGEFSDDEYKKYKEWRKNKPGFVVDAQKYSLSKFAMRNIVPEQVINMFNMKMDLAQTNNRLERVEKAILGQRGNVPVMSDKGTFHLAKKGQFKTERYFKRR